MNVLVVVTIGMIVLASQIPVAVATPEATPATPVASPVATNGCDALPAYFQQLATLTRDNVGYVTVRTNPNGVFDIPTDEAEEIAVSLDLLIAELDAIEPPAPALDFHEAFSQLVLWYRDLATAEDFSSYQRIVNRDQRLIPALSQATFSGQSICGATAWTNAWDDAFGNDD
jgi:hypothetical protein